MKALLLAGGSGTRLWPASRKNFPKQFMKINGGPSFLRQTAERLRAAEGIGDIVVVTSGDYKFQVSAELEGVSGSHVLFEPVPRNTAPAIALGIAYCEEKLGCGPNDVVFVSPSDHIVKPEEGLGKYLDMAKEIAREGHIVTFGVKPMRPETGYGYIKVKGGNAGYYGVEKFTEKPDIGTARGYMEDGSYYWNSGMLAFSIGVMKEELKRHVPEIGRMLGHGYEDMLAGFERMPDISIDFAVMENSDRTVALPLELYWNDIGSWDSIYDALDKDETGNASVGDVISLDTKGTMVIGGRRLVVAIGIEDCLIVESDDALLVAKKGHAQRVKEVVKALKRESRREASEHKTTARPWGSYTVLEEGKRYKIKRIVVNPLEKLSLQLHHHRSEHWVVVRGTARVSVGEHEMLVHENESAYVPKSSPHRLENPGKVPLEMIEVQNGEYLGEDDIVRSEDIYGRI